jgi:hypothetical protein
MLPTCRARSVLFRVGRVFPTASRQQNDRAMNRSAGQRIRSRRFWRAAYCLVKGPLATRLTRQPSIESGMVALTTGWLGSK